jgi:hypothetical protein
MTENSDPSGRTTVGCVVGEGDDDNNVERK